MNILLDFTTIKAAKRNDASNPITAAFFALMEGIKQTKHKLVASAQEADCVFVFGSITKRKPDTERAKSIQSHRRNNKKILSLDSALFSTYIRRHLQSSETWFFRIGLGDCTGEGNFLNENAPRTRYEALSKTFNFSMCPPRRDNTLPIFFALQSEKGWTYDEEEPYYQWAKRTIGEIRNHTDRTIILKPHPNTDRHPIEWITEGHTNIKILRQDPSRRDIIDDLRGVGAFVTHSSSAACESYVEGIPTFALNKRCVVYNTCEKDLSKINKIETINWLDRPQTLWNWAYTSWHVNELKNPALINYYMDRL